MLTDLKHSHKIYLLKNSQKIYLLKNSRTIGPLALQAELLILVIILPLQTFYLLKFKHQYDDAAMQILKILMVDGSGVEDDGGGGDVDVGDGGSHLITV